MKFGCRVIFIVAHVVNMLWSHVIFKCFILYSHYNFVDVAYMRYLLGSDVAVTTQRNVLE
jgi:hypothetical protein